MTTWPWSEVISIPELISLYEEAMRRFGGKQSPPREGCLEQCLGAAHHAELYHSDPGVKFGLRFAASLMVYLAKDNCFTDGNKRIAWSSMVYVLRRRFGLAIDASDDEAEKLTTDVLERRLDVDQVLVWIGPRLIAA